MFFACIWRRIDRKTNEIETNPNMSYRHPPLLPRNNLASRRLYDCVMVLAGLANCKRHCLDKNSSHWTSSAAAIALTATSFCSETKRCAALLWSVFLILGAYRSFHLPPWHQAQTNRRPSLQALQTLTLISNFAFFHCRFIKRLDVKLRTKIYLFYLFSMWQIRSETPFVF